MVFMIIPYKTGVVKSPTSPNQPGFFFRGSNAVEPDTPRFDDENRTSNAWSQTSSLNKYPELRFAGLVISEKVPNIFPYSLKWWCKTVMNSMVPVESAKNHLKETTQAAVRQDFKNKFIQNLLQSSI